MDIRSLEQLDQLLRSLRGTGALPHKERGGESQRAAESNADAMADLRGQIAREYVKAFPGGLTADECAAELRVSVLSARPRVSELFQLGLLRKSGERRRNRSTMTATVWRASALLVGEDEAAAAEGRPFQRSLEISPSIAPGVAINGGAE